MTVNTYMRRVRAVINPHTGRWNLQRWHVTESGEIGWHGIPGGSDSSKGART